MPQPHPRIATWNLERPKQNSWAKNPRLLSQVNVINADLWILTETNAAIALTGYEPVQSLPLQNYHQQGENFVTLWSRWPILQQLPTFDPVYAVCAEVDSPWGAMIVYGTLIVYRDEPDAHGQVIQWQEHRRSLRQNCEDWARLRKDYPQHKFCIAGDFNQNLDDTVWYGDREAREFLCTALEQLQLRCCTTKDFRAAGFSRATIDHIFLSKDLDSHFIEMAAWEGINPAREKMSDHNGVWVELKLPTP